MTRAKHKYAIEFWSTSTDPDCTKLGLDLAGSSIQPVQTPATSSALSSHYCRVR